MDGFLLVTFYLPINNYQDSYHEKYEISFGIIKEFLIERMIEHLRMYINKHEYNKKYKKIKLSWQCIVIFYNFGLMYGLKGLIPLIYHIAIISISL